MLSTSDLYEEIDIIEKVIADEKDAYKRASLKALVLLLKMEHSQRTNTVQIMKHYKIPTVKPKDKTVSSETHE